MGGVTFTRPVEPINVKFDTVVTRMKKGRVSYIELEFAPTVHWKVYLQRFLDNPALRPDTINEHWVLVSVLGVGSIYLDTRQRINPGPLQNMLQAYNCPGRISVLVQFLNAVFERVNLPD